jgi:two-component system, NtrC family, response regulator AtoC
MGSILVVDDDTDTRTLLSERLAKHDLRVHAVDSGAACLTWLRDHDVDVVIADIHMPGLSGTQLAAILTERYPDVLTIMLTGHAALETAIEAVRGGAYDYLAKPIKVDAVALAIRRALDHLATRRAVQRLRRDADVTQPIDTIVGASEPVRALTKVIRSVADGDAPVFITGESGTGKELVAHALHDLSRRRAQPFVAINCGAMPAPLLESELFGHVKGAFTDAKGARAGLFLQAGKGTIFLDEIGEMPLDMQVKLLRVLQERTVRPVGGDTETAFDARVITATNRDLETEVDEGRFREDLFYRINVVAIPVPALSDRSTDILVIAEHLIAKIAARANAPTPPLAPELTKKLLDYDWPGNVRELENTIERMMAMAKHGAFATDALPRKILDYVPKRLEIALVPDQLVTLQEMELRYVRQVLARVNGNKSQAARILGIDRRSLYRKLEGAPSV